MFLYDFFNKSDGGEIFLFLLKHAFKTKTLHLSVWKKKQLLIVFLNYRLDIAHEQEAATPKLLADWLFWVSFYLKKSRLYAHSFTLKAFIKPFEARQRSVKIKIPVNFYFNISFLNAQDGKG